MKCILLLLLVVISGCALEKHSINELREPYGKYQGWICIYPAPSATGDECVAQVMSCQWAFENCKGLRVLANYKIKIAHFYKPIPKDMDFGTWEKCFRSQVDTAFKGYE